MIYLYWLFALLLAHLRSPWGFPEVYMHYLALHLNYPSLTSISFVHSFFFPRFIDRIIRMQWVIVCSTDGLFLHASTSTWLGWFHSVTLVSRYCRYFDYATVGRREDCLVAFLGCFMHVSRHVGPRCPGIGYMQRWAAYLNHGFSITPVLDLAVDRPRLSW